MMEVVVTTTNRPTTSFLQARCPSCRPTNSVRALNGNTPTWSDRLEKIGPLNKSRISLHFNGHFPGEPWLAGVY